MCLREDVGCFVGSFDFGDVAFLEPSYISVCEERKRTFSLSSLLFEFLFLTVNTSVVSLFRSMEIDHM